MSANGQPVDLDVDALGRWLIGAVPGADGPIRVVKFSGGQSNPTYRLDAGDSRFVLRRKPFGPLLPSAHAIEREYRLLAALHPTGFPVPRPIAICEASEVIGVPFYVMGLVEGANFGDGTLPDVGPERRARIYGSMIDTLARLHRIEPEAVGLSDYGRSGNYFGRQMDRWTRQYRASETGRIGTMERLIAWLGATIPEQSGRGIVHGDFRIDNLIFAPEADEVAAVLDWELSTLGDPMADLTYLAMNWLTPPDGRSGLAGVDLRTLGIPSLEEVLARYREGVGRRSLEPLPWYLAFNQFRAACIAQGIRKRLADGNASSEAAATVAAQVPAYVERAWKFAEQAGAARGP